MTMIDKATFDVLKRELAATMTTFDSVLWRVMPETNETHGNRAYLTDSVITLSLHAGEYGNENRLRVSAVYQEGTEHFAPSHYRRDNDPDCPKDITLSIVRPIEDVAKDILRRIVPKLRKAQALAWESKVQEDNHQAELNAAADRLGMFEGMPEAIRHGETYKRVWSVNRFSKPNAKVSLVLTRDEGTDKVVPEVTITLSALNEQQAAAAIALIPRVDEPPECGKLDCRYYNRFCQHPDGWRCENSGNRFNYEPKEVRPKAKSE
jgi:hypothetical protein